MKKEEQKKIKNWCEYMAFLVKLTSDLKKNVPKGIEIINERPADKEVHVYEGIEKIASALKAVIHIETNDQFCEKTVYYKGTTFFQIVWYSEVMSQ